MASLDAQHLVVGGGILALLVAERLLARGATGVVVLSGSGQASEHGADRHALALATGLPAYGELEQRGRAVLEECARELGFERNWRNCGSASFPLFLESEDAQTLDAGQARERQLGLTLEDDEEVAFYAEDGCLEGDTVGAALAASIRERGGLVASTADLYSLTPCEPDVRDGFDYVSSNRHGRAARVYLVSGTDNRRALDGLQLSHELPVSTWHRFELETPPCTASVVRLEDGDGAIVAADGEGGLVVWLPAPHDGSVGEPSVDWARLQTFRSRSEGRVTALEGARVRRGSARHLLDLDTRAPGIVREYDDRLLVAGAFGPHLFPLAPGIADLLAELGA